jgi:hypothetical protein
MDGENDCADVLRMPHCGVGAISLCHHPGNLLLRLFYLKVKYATFFNTANFPDVAFLSLQYLMWLGAIDP